MKIFVLASIAMIVIAGPVAAQLDPDDDGIGVYFDPCACVICMPMEPGVHTGYVIVTHPTSPLGVGGWEAKITWDGPATVGNWNLQGGFNYAMNNYEWIVGEATPLINPFTFPAIIVATFDLTLIDDAVPVNFWIDGIQQHSLPYRQPAYLDGSDYNIIKPLQQPTGGPQYPVATLNGGCAVPNEDLTWGDVKALFR
ncbi:hypothetical protein DRQ50_05850 [bacterium]|nr:MAG: hypothetical protein DRQ50_05850 [bacterium]